MRHPVAAGSIAAAIFIILLTGSVLAKNAWWITASFEPSHAEILGIPVEELDTDWGEASILTKEMLPPVEESDSGVFAYRAFDFQVKGDFNKDGVPDLAAVGIYRSKSGTTGRFLLIVTEDASGGWKKDFLWMLPGRPGFSFLKLPKDSAVLRISSCLECDSWENLILTSDGYRVEQVSCCEE